ncbi:hypothetical protein Vqi01_59330 [Micromonospora qiuiae]|uniref:Uncharacterized protein n=1 Tax=Micromonospora qiuiae TaxID=502268 RepID=A0ABQ4JJZ1_9ACTN|nr:hypothetical protein Vqi01_59330 [Micromonospora qiuiae]
MGCQPFEKGGQLVGAPARVGIVLALAGACRIGQEPKPRVGVEARRAEAHKLLPRQVATGDPIGGRQFPTEVGTSLCQGVGSREVSNLLDWWRRSGSAAMIFEVVVGVARETPAAHGLAP